MKKYNYWFLSLIIVCIAASSFFAAETLLGNAYQITLQTGFPFYSISIKIDALSAWMILIINFTVFTGSIYGIGYLKKYTADKPNYLFHLLFIIVFYLSMISVTIVQNFLLFLVVWELMAISSFLLVIFEHSKKETIRAGINYLVQSHIGVLFITVGFIWVAVKTGSYDFNSIAVFSSSVPQSLSIILFLIFFIGFGFKAGFVPFHTWLPYAHPAAPSHVSGMMSGVIIKMGIYGILRVALLLKTNYMIIGEIILVFSAISGLYGVMLAIIQHNIKKLLAYHSIENIGIIGMGIGLGFVGLGLQNDLLAITGFAGGLLHMLNHSLFKSLLFYGAGSVYQKTHTLNIEKLGGLIKSMPKTALLFLLAALAISGLPPFNGFISEFLIYSGLFEGLKSTDFAFSIFILTVIVSLVLIGGLAVFCFTKAFGIIFLGSPRHIFDETPHEVSKQMLFPQYLTALLIVAIGVFPQMFFQLLLKPVALFVPGLESSKYFLFLQQSQVLYSIGLLAVLVALITFILYWIKTKVTSKRVVSVAPTWGCGYVAPNSNMQYTASSYVKTYTNLTEPLLSITKSEVNLKDVFPEKQSYKTSSYDKVEKLLIDKIIKTVKKILSKFSFIQNGRIQYYILYGLVFILLIILYSYGSSFLKIFYNFLKIF